MINAFDDIDEPDFKFGGKDVTYDRLKQKVEELQKKRIAECKKHELVFVQNIFESETPKSEWKCSKCGKVKYKRYYNKKG